MDEHPISHVEWLSRDWYWNARDLHSFYDLLTLPMMDNELRDMY